MAGTLVKTPAGDQPIETLKVGDLVAAKNDQTGEIAYKPILQLFQNPGKPIYTVSLVNAAGEAVETFGVTDEHPFWTQEKGWVQTESLEVGQQVVLKDGSQLQVGSVVLGTEKQATYNFAVADFSTYFVGESGVWVHNAPCDRVIKSAADRASEIHKAVPEATQRRTTIAVTETKEGVRVVSSSEKRLRPAQRKLLGNNEVEGVGLGHAEVTGINHVRGAGVEYQIKITHFTK